MALLVSCEYVDDYTGGGGIVSVSPTSVLKENIQYVLPFTVLSDEGDVEIRNGGFGSAATAHPTEEGEFYAITDRGPNTDFLDGKKFPVADYAPRIGHFGVTKQGTIIKLDEILLRYPEGKPISGLPNPECKGATGEIPYDAAGNPLPFDDFGIDSEGLVTLKTVLFESPTSTAQYRL